MKGESEEAQINTLFRIKEMSKLTGFRTVQAADITKQYNQLPVLDSLREALRRINPQLVTQRDHEIQASSDSSHFSNVSNGNAKCEDGAGNVPDPPQDPTSSNTPSQPQKNPTAKSAAHYENTSTCKYDVQRR